MTDRLEQIKEWDSRHTHTPGSCDIAYLIERVESAEQLLEYNYMRVNLEEAKARIAELTEALREIDRIARLRTGCDAFSRRVAAVLPIEVSDD